MLFRSLRFFDCSSSPLSEMLNPRASSLMGSAVTFWDFFRFLLFPLKLKNKLREDLSSLPIFFFFFLTCFFLVRVAVFVFSAGVVFSLFFGVPFRSTCFLVLFFFFFGLPLAGVEKRFVMVLKRPMVHHFELKFVVVPSWTICKMDSSDKGLG